MANSTKAYRVKVLVDGDWKSTGDFRELDRARQHARMIALHLERHVEIRDGYGRLIECDFLSLAGDETDTVTFDDQPANQTISLD